MESNQRPRTERLTEASLRPPGRATEAYDDVRASPTTKPSSSSSSSSPSVGLKKAPTSRARDPSSRRCGGGRPRWRAAAPKPWWEYEEALARLAFELRGEAAAQRAAHTNSCGQRRLALRARGGWRPGEPPSARRLPPRLSSPPSARRLPPRLSCLARLHSQLAQLMERCLGRECLD